MAKRTRLTATQKLRKLVQQQVRRMEHRGYRVDTSLKEKIKTGKYQTLKSIQKNKYKKLYESSSSEIEGKIVSGEEKRSYERSESAKRSAVTRKLKREQREHDKRVFQEAYDSAERQRREKELEEDEDELWKDVEAAMAPMMEQFVAMREREGERIEKDLCQRVEYMKTLCEKIDKRSPETVKEYQDKL